MCDDVEMDVAAVGSVIDAFAEVVGDVRAGADAAGRCAFGRVAAGRDYGDVGERIASGYARMSSSLRLWAEGIEEISEQLRASADGCRGVDESAAESLSARSGGYR